MAILEQSPLYREIVENSEKRGIALGIQRVALNMLRMGMARSQVSEATGLSVEQVARLLEKSSVSE